MAQIRGDKQIKAGTISKDRLQSDFLKGTDWNPNAGSATPATITGIPDPVNPLDVVNKQTLEARLAEVGGGGGAVEVSKTFALLSDGTQTLVLNSIPTAGTIKAYLNGVLNSASFFTWDNLQTLTIADGKAFAGDTVTVTYDLAS